MRRQLTQKQTQLLKCLKLRACAYCLLVGRVEVFVAVPHVCAVVVADCGLVFGKLRKTLRHFVYVTCALLRDVGDYVVEVGRVAVGRHRFQQFVQCFADYGAYFVQFAVVLVQLRLCAVKGCGFVCGAAGQAAFAKAKSGAKFLYYILFVGFVAVQLQTEFRQPGVLQFVKYDVERGKFFRHKQHFFAAVQTFRNDVGNCLAFARARWTLKHETAPVACIAYGFCLTCVGVYHVVKFVHKRVCRVVAVVGLRFGDVGLCSVKVNGVAA